ncbi:hypothetical protein BDW42DRAFT_32635 [Aspergillus taichungensis]|uniref:Uncharacterized protein n=1 Tax=Aspergillus taichungensis TaxID=482145 RepID=A0A2J5HFU4_9EURO|nr:hypothetical protein BDW42DRAFT_32635 [Aspergillus taichungensis]
MSNETSQSTQMSSLQLIRPQAKQHTYVKCHDASKVSLADRGDKNDREYMGATGHCACRVDFFPISKLVVAPARPFHDRQTDCRAKENGRGNKKKEERKKKKTGTKRKKEKRVVTGRWANRPNSCRPPTSDLSLAVQLASLTTGKHRVGWSVLQPR